MRGGGGGGEGESLGIRLGCLIPTYFLFLENLG